MICPAEHLPFADSSFDLVVTRIAPHHFEDIALAVAEMARVTREQLIVEDTLYVSEAVEEAERLRDPTTSAPTPSTSGARSSRRPA